jgi:serine/threonine protein kinase
MEDIGVIAKDLHAVIVATHQNKMRICDLAPDNILIERNARFFKSIVVDFDSIEWGSFKSPAFTWEYTDPLLLGPSDIPGQVKLISDYTDLTDWYSYEAVVFQMYTRLSPYGCTVDTKHALKWKVPDQHRPLHRLCALHEDIGYPVSGAVPLNRFSEELVDHWRETFLNDKRGIFPLRLLTQLKWTMCINPSCKTVYASSVCPVCHSSRS